MLVSIKFKFLTGILSKKEGARKQKVYYMSISKVIYNGI